MDGVVSFGHERQNIHIEHAEEVRQRSSERALND